MIFARLTPHIEAMNPFVMFLLAIFSPFLLAAALLLPAYAGVAGAGYVIYHFSVPPHALSNKLLDVFYMIDVYSGAFGHWKHHILQVDFLTYTLPLLLLPILGLTFSLMLTAKLSRKLMDIFHLGASM